jgi:hypothetical protein
MILAGDVATAKTELEAALERVSQRVIAEHLSVLDNSIGLNVSRLVLTKFALPPAAEEAKIEQVDNTTESYSDSRPPLALAAHAAMGSGEVFDMDADPISTMEVATVEVLDV